MARTTLLRRRSRQRCQVEKLVAAVVPTVAALASLRTGTTIPKIPGETLAKL